VSYNQQSQPLWGPLPAVGNYYHGGHPRSIVTTFAPAANRLYAIPYIVDYPMSFDFMSFKVTTLETNGEARLGIYNDLNGVPGSLLVDAGTVATTGTGIKTLAIDQALSPGLWWLGIVFNTVATLVINQDATTEAELYLGATSSVQAPLCSAYVAHTYGVLPDPFGTPTYATDSCIRLLMRRSA
jgi:hypothetical protein